MRGGPAKSGLGNGPHSSNPPYDGSGKGDGDGAHKALHVSVKARRDPPPVLDAAERALDGIAAVVRGLVRIALDFAITARWNDGLRDSFFELFSRRAASPALVGDEFGGGRQHRDSNLRDPPVVDASARQKQDAGAAPAVADAMEITVGRVSCGRDHGQAPFSAPGAAGDLDVGPFDGQSLRRVGAAANRKIHFAYCEDSPRQLSRVDTRAKTLAPLRETGNVTALFGAAFAIARATKSH